MLYNMMDNVLVSNITDEAESGRLCLYLLHILFFDS